MVSISSSTGNKNIKVLPDSGADISAAGQHIMRYLGHYKSNLVPSIITPRTVNGSRMTPVGKIPVIIQLKDRQYKDDIHICPGVSGPLISWKATKELRILPPHYPYPQASSNEGAQPEIKTTTIGNNIQIATEEQIMLEFPSVFDGQVRMMEGEKFHISVMEEVVYTILCQNTASGAICIPREAKGRTRVTPRAGDHHSSKRSHRMVYTNSGYP